MTAVDGIQWFAPHIDENTDATYTGFFFFFNFFLIGGPQTRSGLGRNSVDALYIIERITM